MRVLIVISQLQCGGAERVVYQLYHLLRKLGHKMMLVLLNRRDCALFPNIYEEDICHMPHVHGKIIGNIRRVIFIRKQIRLFQSDVVLSFIDVANVLTLIATIGFAVPVIISERNNPHKSGMSKIWFLLRRLTYPFASSLVVANNNLASCCRALNFNNAIDVIPNILSVFTHSLNRKKYFRILAVGSLTQQKRFDLLIDAVSKLVTQDIFGDYRLDIFGEGELRAQLQNKINQLNLSSYICLCGKTNDISKEYQESDIFVLCSDYEGQPNVLLEAMSSGLACISTDCDYGPREIIDNNQDGLLVPVDDINQLASSIYQLISNHGLRIKLGKAAQNKICSQFSQEVIIQKWLNLFKELTKKNACHCTSL